MNTLLKYWNIRRVLYLIGGVFFVLVAVNDRSWWMIPFGLYFISMAVFRFGCATGNCEVPFSKEDVKTQN
ncbi:hypothetical protein IV494_10355 [Kaistella sp. G5-32]|uniref:DUF2892 domain-containing protein n=1 Tax=Kaistella gelatinilytica TaxID=2787636 RepID=A0ABS0FCY0_9FLAO|nr:hypothetical protein [Kaistella gelatinilytica]MBF8457579.1 hypothetical protein [Kaistella gelatinilytica]